jgi:uncharacterized membrane protein (DUF485 family)
MSLSTIIDISGATLGLISALFFSIGVLRLKNTTVEIIATSFYGSGYEMAKELMQQKSEFIFGALFLVLSFSFQLFAKFVSPAVYLSFAPNSTVCGAGIGVALPLLLLVMVYPFYSTYKTKVLEKFENLIKGKI